MNTEVTDILKKALALPPDARAAIAGALLESLSDGGWRRFQAPTPMSRKSSETWGTPFLFGLLTKPSGHAAGGRIVITRMSVSLIFTGPTSPEEYQRKLLHCHCSGEATNPRATGLRWM